MKKNLWLVSLAYLVLPTFNTFAAETPLQNFDLAQYLVTATRYESKDVNTAYSTQIITKEDLERTGTTNIVTALSNMLGITYMGYGPEGSSMGSKNSSLMIRGMDKGTLVLINGSPINLNGRYNLEDFPFDGIERIEIIRGGGAVMYGSEAIGGVINIITSKELSNKVSVGAGNNNRRQYDLNLQLDRLSLAASNKHWGKSAKCSDLLTSAKNMSYYMQEMDRDSIYANYRINDKSNLMFQHTYSKKDYNYYFGEGYATEGDPRYKRLYYYKKDFVQYNFADKDWKANVFYNLNKSETRNADYASSSGSTKGYPQYSHDKDKNYSAGASISKKWNSGKTNYILGADVVHEYYNPDTYATETHSKTDYSIFGSLEHSFNEHDSLTLSGRESWAKMDEKTFSNFSGQAQYIHKLDDSQNLYASVGQSYRMPYLREMYASGNSYLVGNTDLKPEKGIHYEIGWKKASNNHLWKVAFFNYFIKNNISYTLGRSGGQSYSTNQDVTNTGIEASLNYANDKGFRYNIGMTYGNPKAKTHSDNAPSSVTIKDYWDRQYGKAQITGGIGYDYKKLSTNLTANYVFERVASPTSSESFGIKPYLLTSLNVKYSFDKASDLTFTMENLLDRQDNFGGSTTAYYSTPRCFLLKYSYKF